MDSSCGEIEGESDGVADGLISLGISSAAKNPHTLLVALGRFLEAIQEEDLI